MRLSKSRVAKQNKQTRKVLRVLSLLVGGITVDKSVRGAPRVFDFEVCAFFVLTASAEPSYFSARRERERRRLSCHPYRPCPYNAAYDATAGHTVDISVRVQVVVAVG